MGYCSTVAIRCQKKAYEMLRDTCERVGLMPDRVMTRDSGNDMLIVFDWIKWYRAYDQIAAIEDVMQTLSQMDEDEAYDKQCEYRFIRVGEDVGDVEERGNTFDIDLYAETVINFDDFVQNKYKVVPDGMYEELCNTLDDVMNAPTDDSDPDWRSDGEWLDVFINLCSRLKDSIYKGEC